MKRLLFLLLAIMPFLPATAQVVVGGDTDYDIDYLTPKIYEIGGITFEGADHLDTRMVMLVAGLQVGDEVKVPGNKISTAIDNLWKQGLFEDVQILVTRIQNNKIFLKIVLKGRPKLSVFKFKGVKGSDQDKLRDEMKIVSGDVVTENLLTTSKNKIRSYYMEKGFTNVTVNTLTEVDTAGGKNDRVIVTFDVNKGKKVKIDSLIFTGNTQVPTNKLIRKMKNTHDVHYFKKMYFWTGAWWKGSRYKETDLSEDLESVISYYNELGYRDARILFDTVYPVASQDLKISDRKKAKQDRVKIRVDINEGHKFYFRNITFSGNTVYSSETLARHLRINKGDPYNRTQLETNLNYNPSTVDISSMYMDNGYLFFKVTPAEVAVENDSIDIEIRIVEGKQARIRNVIVEGNTITNDKIIMRELHTRPGDLFSRDALLRSRRELVTLGYFREESIIPDARPNPEDGTVDVIYKVEEGSTSQLQLQGGYGSGMVIGQVGIQLNNFSAKNVFNRDAWPLPAGDGQKLGLNAVTNGTYYYALNASFTEPWLGGRRAQSLSVNAYHNLYSNGFYYKKDNPLYYSLRITGGGVSLSKRLKWPDDYFILSQSLSYRHYTLDNYTYLAGSLFTDGEANDLSYGITVSRNSLDSPIYPRSGSEFSVAGFVTPPYSLLRGDRDYATMTSAEKYKWVEYYKVNVRGSWMLNLIGDVVLNARFRFGFLSYFNEDIGVSPFGRYYVGGDGLSSVMLDGREVIPLRGYENNKLSPDDGASVFDRYTLELRQPIIESNSATIYVLGFLEGGNSWAKVKQFQPFKLYNSAGLGVRLFMPMFGLIGVDWGYGFDGLNGGSHFHFSIGQSID